MNGDSGDGPPDVDLSGKSKEELRRELLDTRSRVRELEDELVETNEGMIALTLELENAKERYQTIFEESSDAILVLDSDRDAIHEANPRACDLLGYDRDALVSLSVSDLFPAEGEDFESFSDAVVQGWQEGFTCRTQDGRRVDVDVSASTVTLDGESFLLASLRDVTQRKRRKQRLQVLNRIFRHNLRNDGNVIQGHADILGDALAETDLEANAVRIQSTIDDLLELSGKVRRTQDVLDRDWIHPRDIDELLARQREKSDDRYPEATLEVDPPSRDAVVGQRMGTALREAVENACEHNDPDTTVRISATIEGEDGLQLTVEDDGSGIPDPEREAVQRGGETPLTHGSGIGLWIIRWIVDSLGGKLSVEDRAPHGTVLTMEVPLEEPGSDPRPIRPGTANGS